MDTEIPRGAVGTDRALCGSGSRGPGVGVRKAALGHEVRRGLGFSTYSQGDDGTNRFRRFG